MKKMLMVSVILFFGLSLSMTSSMVAQEKKECDEVKCATHCKTIKDKAKMIKAEYQGKTYCFCCEKCKAEFEKNPEKYIKMCPGKGFYYCAKCKYKSQEAGKCPKCQGELKKHEHKTFYVCPMKECKTKADKPGKCPKCGMELKAVKCCQADHKHDHKHDHTGHSHKH